MSTTDYQTVNYELKGHVALITLNRPDFMNAFNADMRSDFCAAWDQAEQDSNVRVIVIAGNGKNFCSGQDLVEGIEGGLSTQRLLEDEYGPLILRVYQSTKLVISAINGAAAGIGGSLALAGDFCVMSDNAYFFQAFVGIGLIPDGGMHWQLLRRVGYSRALEMIVEGQKLPSQECEKLGLANRVVSSEELLEVTNQWAEQLASKAPIAVSCAKAALKQAVNQSLVESLATEAILQGKASASADAQEGMTAFLEKRKPNFTGK